MLENLLQSIACDFAASQGHHNVPSWECSIAACGWVLCHRYDALYETVPFPRKVIHLIHGPHRCKTVGLERYFVVTFKTYVTKGEAEVKVSERSRTDVGGNR